MDRYIFHLMFVPMAIWASSMMAAFVGYLFFLQFRERHNLLAPALQPSLAHQNSSKVRALGARAKVTPGWTATPSRNWALSGSVLDSARHQLIISTVSGSLFKANPTSTVSEPVEH